MAKFKKKGGARKNNVRRPSSPKGARRAYRGGFVF